MSRLVQEAMEVLHPTVKAFPCKLRAYQRVRAMKVAHPRTETLPMGFYDQAMVQITAPALMTMMVILQDQVATTMMMIPCRHLWNIAYEKA